MNPIKCTYFVAAALMEELNEFTHLLKNRSPDKFQEVQYGSVIDGQKEISVATYTADKMGMPYNAAKLSEVVLKLDPSFIFFIGTCAGVLPKHLVGDVLIPNRAFSYESGKYHDGVFVPDLVSYESDGTLRKLAGEFYFDHKSFLNYKVYTDGDFASGAAVIDDANKKAEIIQVSSRKLYGIDMETYAIACMNDIARNNGKHKFLVVKSISDQAVKKEETEDEGGKEKAKINAADFVYKFISYLDKHTSQNSRMALSNENAKGPIKEPISEGRSNIFTFDFSASYSQNANIHYKLKLMVKIRNNCDKVVVLKSKSFKAQAKFPFHKDAGSKFSKPAFLVSREKISDVLRDVYKEIILLEPQENVLSAWVAFDDSIISENELRNGINERKVGEWTIEYTVIDGGESHTITQTIPV